MGLKQTMKMADSVAATVGLAIAAYVLFTVSSFPEDQVVQVGPAFFPRILAVGLGIFSLVLLVHSFRNKAATRDDVKEPSYSYKDKGLQRALVSLVLTIIFCLSLDVFGFLLSSTVFLLCLMYLLKDRQYVQMTIVAASVTGAVYMVFKTLLDITLPLGTLYGY